MADVYASVVGTTVLQIKEIPVRPVEFDGALALFGLRSGVDEKAVRAALKHFGKIKSCELDSQPAVVRFVKHDAALAAKEAGAPKLCQGLDTLYNERSYDGRRGEVGRKDDDGRGWCETNPSRQIPPVDAFAPQSIPSPHVQVSLGEPGEQRGGRAARGVPKDEGGARHPPAQDARPGQRQAAGASVAC